MNARPALGVRTVLCTLQHLPVPHYVFLGKQSCHKSALTPVCNPLISFRDKKSRKAFWSRHHHILSTFFPIFHKSRKGESCPVIDSWFKLKSVGIRQLNTLREPDRSCSCVEQSPLRWAYFLIPSILSQKLAQGMLLGTQFSLLTPFRHREWNPDPIKAHMVVHTMGIWMSLSSALDIELWNMTGPNPENL